MVNRAGLMILFVLVFAAMFSLPVMAEEAVATNAAAKETQAAAQQPVVSRSEMLLEEIISRLKPQEKVEKEEPSPLLVSKEVTMIEKKISGHVTGMGANGIAIAYEVDQTKKMASEMWLPFADSIKLIGYQARTEIKIGDDVTALYDEADDHSSKLLKAIMNNKPEAAAPAPAGKEKK